MSTQQAYSSSNKNTCVITNVDSLVGYALAYRFLQAIRDGEDHEAQTRKIRLFCREKNGMDLERLEKMGAEIQQVNYKDENKIREYLRDVKNILLIPEHSHETVKEAEILIKAAKHQDVEHFAVMTCVGVGCFQQDNERDTASSGGQFRNYQNLHRIEEMVKQQFSGEKHCIVRYSVLNQLNYYLAPQIEGENQLPLPVKKEAKWSPVDLNDVVEAVYRLARQQHQQGENDKRVYNFVSSKSMKSEEIAREIGQGLGQDNLKFREISSDDFKKMIDRSKNDERFHERPDFDGNFKEGRDGWWSFPVSSFINDQKIELLNEYWQLANKGKLDNLDSNDLQKILERKPRSLKDYFKVNRDNFKKFK